MKEEYLENVIDQLKLETTTYTLIQNHLQQIHDDYMEPYSDGTKNLIEVFEQLRKFYKFAFFWFVDRELKGTLPSLKANEVVACLIAEWKKSKGECAGGPY